MPDLSPQTRREALKIPRIEGSKARHEIRYRLIVAFALCGVLSIKRSRVNINDRIGSARKQGCRHRDLCDACVQLK